MTPLIVIPARQMSQGRPCKNREGWQALMTCLHALQFPPGVLVTDDPWLARVPGLDMFEVRWLVMNAGHTVAEAVRFALKTMDPAFDVVVVMQPSSPTCGRDGYILGALDHLGTHPESSSVISVVPWTGEPPSKACTLNPDGTLAIPPTPEPRQLQPQHYRRDGTVYAVRRQYAEQGDLYGPRPIPLLIDPKDSVTLD